MIKIVGVGIPTNTQKGQTQVEDYILLSGKEYSVGRKQQDISLHKDTSISRNHATIQVDHPIANVTNAALIPSLVITDLGSKFGTFINDGIEANRPVSMREPNTLSHGDRFRFGLAQSQFRIHYTPLVATSSCVKSSSSLKRNLCALGGHLVPEWTEKCDFLIMETLTLTVKVVCAILSAKPIVTPAFFEDYLAAIQNKKATVPRPEDYLPILAETSLTKGVSFYPESRRTTLFRNKIFLFTSAKQSKKIGAAITCAGGTVDLITNLNHDGLKSPETIVIAPMDDITPTGPIKNALDIYESAKKRLIHESEIGLAAVYNSVDKHCNPFFNVSPIPDFPNIASQTQEPGMSNDDEDRRTASSTSREKKRSKPIDNTDDEDAGPSKSNAKKLKPSDNAESSVPPMDDSHDTISTGSIKNALHISKSANKRLIQGSEDREVNIASQSQEPGTSKDDEDDNTTDSISKEKKRSKPNDNTDDEVVVLSKTITKKFKTSESTLTPSKSSADWHNVTGVKKLVLEGDITASQGPFQPAPVEFKSLLVKRESVPSPQLEKAGEKIVKNFKVFKKVPPLSAVDTNSMVSNINVNSNSNRTTASVVSFRRHDVPINPRAIAVEENFMPPPRAPALVTQVQVEEPDQFGFFF